MGWRNWSYWLRGGIIGLFIGIILEVIGTICFPFAGFPSQCPPTIILHLPLISLSNLGYIALILVSIIIGTVIGFIIGKIKSLNGRKR